MAGERLAMTPSVPYYDDGTCTIYHADCREVSPDLAADVVVTDPPYPNRAALRTKKLAANHFEEQVGTAEWFCQTFQAQAWLIFWDELHRPPVPLPLVALHVWHRSNSNRPNNYEAIYEFGQGPERASRVFSYPVVYPGLTGCNEATGHPTQKSERLMLRLLQLRPHGVVLDPFMGSGTTLRAAKDLGRRAIGIEIEERYCEIAAKRLGQEVLAL